MWARTRLGERMRSGRSYPGRMVHPGPVVLASGMMCAGAVLAVWLIRGITLKSRGSDVSSGQRQVLVVY